MSNDYFKAQGWFKNYATSSEDSRGMFQQLVKDDEEAFRLASAETDRIKEEMNKKFGSGTIKYGSEIPQPEMKTPQAIFEFGQRNPAAEGGRMGFNKGLSAKQKKALTIKYPKDATKDLEIKKINRDESYRKVVKDFTATSGPGTGKIFDDPTVIDIVKANLNKIKKQKNNKAFFEWSENSDWYKALQKELNPNTKKGTNREYTNKLINKVVDEFFTGAYHGKNAIKNFRNDTVVKSFIQHLKSVGEFNGQEKFDKVLNQFTYKKDGKRKNADHLYEDINRSWKSWINGEFEVEGVDRAELKKELKARGIDYSQIDNWSASSAQGRGTAKIKELITLNNFNRFTNKSAEEIRALFLKKHPNANFDLRVNELTQLKRNGVYVSGANTELPVTGIEKGDRAGWLKKAYGKQFAGNYSKIINAADQLAAAGETAKAERLYKAADKFFGPTGIIRKSAVGEAEHALARSFDFLNPDRQLAINSIVDGDLNQFKKNLFDIPVKEYVREYNQEGTTNARKKELKNLIENRKKTMNALTGGQKEGIVAGDIVSFQYGDKIKPTSSVKAIDVLFDEGKFDIDEYIAKGNAYGEALKKTGLNIDTASSNKIINEKKLKEINDYIDGKKDFVGFSSGFNTDLLMKDPAVQKILNSKAGQAVKNAARGTVGTVGKVFGVADIVLGALDYENNISKGQKPSEALGNAVQAMSFNLYKSGDKARIADVKERFVAKGGNGEIFDQATNLNAKDQEINDLIYKSKFTADKAFMDLSQPQAILGKSINQRKEDYGILKKQLNEEIKNKMQERDNMIKSYKTNLQVSEAGAPIQIGGNEFFSQPFKDVKQSTMDKIAEENRKAYDMQKRQVNFTSGNIGNFLQNNIFTMNPQEKAELQRQINNMDERELYKFNLSRGMDPDNLIRFEDILRYKTNDPSLMGVNTTKYINKRDQKSEGGITTLRSKYEYKK